MQPGTVARMQALLGLHVIDIKPTGTLVIKIGHDHVQVRDPNPPTILITALSAGCAVDQLWLSCSVSYPNVARLEVGYLLYNLIVA